MVPHEFCDPPLTAGVKSCSQFLPTNKIVRERSTCPWYVTIIHDPTIFPPRRTEAVCRCEGCIESYRHHKCVTVFTKMTFLKRTPECIDGLYMYVPLVMDVAVACTCAANIEKVDNASIYDYVYDTEI
uniref:Interleukin 17-like protein n=1 Tax=Octopus bimaculoides TaxID=37653 RepID=A0A0L8HUA3_OCTBM